MLKRLTLISGNPYADTDSAASLLESKHKYSEALQFLQPLVQSSPWDASVKVRLAVAMLAVEAQAPQALAALNAVAADPKATYAERLAAARALKGSGAANPAIRQRGTELLARDSCPSEDEAGKPLLRSIADAAGCLHANDKNTRERLLRAAMAASPSDSALRLQYRFRRI